jgi:hypothetical protein
MRKLAVVNVDFSEDLQVAVPKWEVLEVIPIMQENFELLVKQALKMSLRPVGQNNGVHPVAFPAHLICISVRTGRPRVDDMLVEQVFRVTRDNDPACARERRTEAKA